VSKYTKGDNIKLNAKAISDKKLKRELVAADKTIKAAALASAKAEILNTASVGYLEAEGMERTYKFKQAAIAKAVDIQTSRKIQDISLPTFGPYNIDYLRSGRFLLLGGSKGHIAMVDALRSNVVTELHVKQSIHDIKFLHNETMFAVAQKKYVYIYDKTGMELHCLRNHLEPLKLEFLPYHFLLASVGQTGYLKYQDTSTGKLVAEHRTKLGPCNVMQMNSYNAILHLGHA
jgi:U3 small nucleolar RNA-associated protein 7